MAMKKKSFDAVAKSRRWRISTGKRLAAITPRNAVNTCGVRPGCFLPRSRPAVPRLSHTAKVHYFVPITRRHGAGSGRRFALG